MQGLESLPLLRGPLLNGERLVTEALTLNRAIPSLHPWKSVGSQGYNSTLDWTVRKLGNRCIEAGGGCTTCGVLSVPA